MWRRRTKTYSSWRVRHVVVSISSLRFLYRRTNKTQNVYVTLPGQCSVRIAQPPLGRSETDQSNDVNFTILNNGIIIRVHGRATEELGQLHYHTRAHKRTHAHSHVRAHAHPFTPSLLLYYGSIATRSVGTYKYFVYKYYIPAHPYYPLCTIAHVSGRQS